MRSTQRDDLPLTIGRRVPVRPYSDRILAEYNGITNVHRERRADRCSDRPLMSSGSGSRYGCLRKYFVAFETLGGVRPTAGATPW